MTVQIKVPPLGESVTEATIAKWFKQKGDSVKKNDILVELETDKVALEVSAETDGILAEVKVKEGETVAVGAVLGSITEGAVSKETQVKEEKKPATNEKPIAASVSETSKKEDLSPAVRKMVVENNVDTSSIAGTGKDGRIIKGDVIASLNTESTSISASNRGIREQRVKMTRLRKRIAERLKESQNTAAMLTTFNEVDMTSIMQLRAKHQEAFMKKHNVKLGFMSFFVKAVVAALKEIPAVNAEIEGDDIVYKNYYDIGIAVGTEQGLVVPVLRDADKLSFAEIEIEIANLAKKAREGKLSMQDLTGGTFTITNGGIYGSLLSTPIINPPQSGILGMHKTQDRAVVVDGKIEIRPMMYTALSYDHRLIDGKEAVTFLVKVKENIELPDRLLFDL
jgi:2-oxoglutarate dehydrogenase E2 component (dihydrolipoamide succinyltransferase)